MTHTDLGPGREFDRVRAIERALGRHATALGDDCAVVGPSAHRLVLSTDVSVEDVHFRRRWLRLDEIGWRATAAALSDLAAEGAEPIGVLVALTVPGEMSDTDVTELMRGAGDAVAAVGGTVLGGDLSRGPSVALAVTVVGRAARPVSRKGAQPGDAIWVTGVLGGARAALQAWQAGLEPSAATRLAFAHPRPRIAAGRVLARLGATAMMDLSDGLAGDARHLAAASGVQLAIDAGRIPLGEGVSEAARAVAQPPAAFAAEGGEDYELLVTMPAGTEQAVREATLEAQAPLTCIGEVRAGTGVEVVLDGHRLELVGFDHFR
jgi:thiamine-monophosphate kinase